MGGLGIWCREGESPTAVPAGSVKSIRYEHLLNTTNLTEFQYSHLFQLKQ